MGHDRPPGEHEDEGEEIDAGPEAALLRQAETRLEQDRIAEQPAYAREVARRVEEVGIARRGVPRAREPALEKRARRRDREEGEPDGGREQREQPRDRVR